MERMFTPHNMSHAMCHIHVSHVTCHVSHVMCHISCVTCHVSHVTFFLTKWWSLSVEGLLSTGPTLYRYLVCRKHLLSNQTKAISHALDFFQWGQCRSQMYFPIFPCLCVALLSLFTCFVICDFYSCVATKFTFELKVLFVFLNSFHNCSSDWCPYDIKSFFLVHIDNIYSLVSRVNILSDICCTVDLSWHIPFLVTFSTFSLVICLFTYPELFICKYAQLLLNLQDMSIWNHIQLFWCIFLTKFIWSLNLQYSYFHDDKLNLLFSLTF